MVLGSRSVGGARGRRRTLGCEAFNRSLRVGGEVRAQHSLAEDVNQSFFINEARVHADGGQGGGEAGRRGDGRIPPNSVPSSRWPTTSPMTAHHRFLRSVQHPCTALAHTAVQHPRTALAHTAVQPYGQRLPHGHPCWVSLGVFSAVSFAVTRSPSATSSSCALINWFGFMFSSRFGATAAPILSWHHFSIPWLRAGT